MTPFAPVDFQDPDLFIPTPIKMGHSVFIPNSGRVEIVEQKTAIQEKTEEFSLLYLRAIRAFLSALTDVQITKIQKTSRASRDVLPLYDAIVRSSDISPEDYKARKHLVALKKCLMKEIHELKNDCASLSVQPILTLLNKEYSPFVMAYLDLVYRNLYKTYLSLPDLNSALAMAQTRLVKVLGQFDALVYDSKNYIKSVCALVGIYDEKVIKALSTMVDEIEGRWDQSTLVLQESEEEKIEGMANFQYVAGETPDEKHEYVLTCLVGIVGWMQDATLPASVRKEDEAQIVKDILS